MSLEKASQIGDTLREAVVQGDIPGGVAVIARYGQRVRFACGNAVDDESGKVPVSFDTVYDCASLTKVVVTLPLVLMLADQGKLQLDDPVTTYLPAFTAAQGQHADIVTIRHLLTHTAGLAPYMNLYSHGWSREEIIARVCGAPLKSEPGSAVEYSDLGYILLGEIVAEVAGTPLATLAATALFAPLGMAASGYLPAASLRRRMAGTEPDPGLGGGCVLGVVHDENARAMGGVSGHAGLFSTADDLASYAEMWLGGGRSAAGRRVLSAAAVEVATRTCTAGVPGGKRGLGWVLRGDPFDAAGDQFSPVSYGHTGFTGTSVYVDPLRELVCVLLTNRVHYGRERSIAGLRSKFHNAAVAALVD
ncbi:serine hydrolase domain-containing protein [Paenibacillus puldeungensis]